MDGWWLPKGSASGGLHTRVCSLGDEAGPGGHRRTGPADERQDAVVGPPRLGRDRAAHVPALAVEELDVRVLAEHGLAAGGRVRAVAAAGDRGPDELDAE